MNFYFQFMLFYAFIRLKDVNDRNVNEPLEDNTYKSDDYTDSVGLVSISTEKLMEDFSDSIFFSSETEDKKEVEFL